MIWEATINDNQIPSGRYLVISFYGERKSLLERELRGCLHYNLWGSIYLPATKRNRKILQQALGRMPVEGVLELVPSWKLEQI